LRVGHEDAFFDSTGLVFGQSGNYRKALMLKRL